MRIILLLLFALSVAPPSYVELFRDDFSLYNDSNYRATVSLPGWKQ